MEKALAFIKIELKALLREPVSIFFMVILPIILTVVFGGTFGDEMTPYGENVKGIDMVVPVNIVFLLANAGLMGIPITILELKEQGVLKRYSTYPINLRFYFLSLAFTFALVSLLSTFLFGALAFIRYNASFYMNFWECILFIFAYFWIILIFYSIGFLFALFIKSARTASIVTSGFFLAMIFTSGVALPLDSLPEYVQFVAKIFPMSHSIEFVQYLWISELSFNEHLAHIIYLLVAGIVMLIVLRSVKIRWD